MLQLVAFRSMRGMILHLLNASLLASAVAPCPALPWMNMKASVIPLVRKTFVHTFVHTRTHQYHDSYEPGESFSFVRASCSSLSTAKVLVTGGLLLP